MILDLAAVFAAMLAIGGAILGVVGVAGTTKPPGPPSAAARRLRRWWTGPSRNRREQRARQTMMIGAVVAGAAAWLITGWPAAGLIVGVAVPGLPWLFNSGRMERRALARLEAVEAWTRRLADIVARGIGLQQAIVATNASPPQLIAREVADLAARMQSGTEPVLALRQFADDLDDYTADQVVAPLMLHVSDRSEGLHEVLTDISRSIAAEVEMRSTVDAKRAGPRFAVKFLTMMTAGLLALGLLNPTYLKPFGTFTGQMLLLFLTGFYIFLMRMVRNLSLPPERARLLPPIDAEVVNA
ncbi:type II secretion system protein [Actinoplanes sp. OR16]|uniref:type II secretion system F family protein n=1 Tax=Actinoplanes sp. OR16 TaxID=946334 RepID=UPI000F708693|nr:type II secretion system F family protein [Actinoplanes sp. OR16]BBH67108.1 type II secretion system protein [Actinoplanes sp. OR16]